MSLFCKYKVGKRRSAPKNFFKDLLVDEIFFFNLVKKNFF